MKGDASPFSFEGDGRGVVCIHGFTASPFEMRFVGEALARAGMTVRGPTLPGHATSARDLASREWRHWADAVERAIEELSRRCDQVAVVGQSLGGLLALRAAQERGAGLTAVASLAAPLWLTPLARGALWLADRFPRIRTLPKTG